MNSHNASMNKITVKGAFENNLKDVDCAIPKNKFVVVTGVSGSGKSSLVLDTIAKESKRQLFSTFSNFLRSKMEKITKPKFVSISGLQSTIVIDQKRIKGNARSTVGTITDMSGLVRLLFSRCGEPFIGESSCFSFNHPSGMCEECKGVGKVYKVEVEDVIDTDLSLNEGAIIHPDYKLEGYYFNGIKKCKLFDLDKPIKDFNEEELDDLLYHKKMRLGKKGKKFDFQGSFEGVITNLNRKYLKGDVNEKNSRLDFFKKGKCEECGGSRLSKEAREVKYRGKTIVELCSMEIRQFHSFLKECMADKKNPPLVQESSICGELIKKLGTLVDLGIGYLSLDRNTPTLSGGESQRIKVSKQLNCDLVNMVYILDECTIGLHPYQVEQQLEMLKRLRDKGNTVIVIEHDMQVISKADYIIELGEFAGENGGNIIFQGDFEDYKKAKTIGAGFLREHIELEEFKDDEVLRENEDPGEDDEMEYFEIKKANTNNLKNIDVKIPKGQFTAITGIAGSGKSTLIMNCFIKNFKNCVVVNQFKITKTIRSNPATYTGCFDSIRKLFSKKTKQKISLFSFNSKGACPTCKGLGFIKIEMHFLDDAKTPCEDCKGKRFKEEVLEHKVKGKSIYDVLQMSVTEALEFFKKEKIITKKLQLLSDVGLGYLRLGQSLSTLSGGETQRIKLATNLHKTGEIYILDEPTLGLSNYDIEKLLQIIFTLKEKGNSVIVIEHNMDVVKHSDWIIDLGPNAGIYGGEIVYQGKTDGIIDYEAVSHTAKFLKSLLKKRLRSEKEEKDDDDSDDDDSDLKIKKKKRKTK